MTAIVALARVLVRRGLAALVLIGLLGGIGVGFAMTAAAGARRADTAYTRLRDVTLAPDGFFQADGLDAADIARIGELPQVAGVARFSYTPVAPRPLRPGQDAGAFVAFDEDLLDRVYRPLVVEGRLAVPGAADEVVVNESLARVGHLRVGQRVDLDAGFEDVVAIGAATVVGIVRGTFDVGVNSGNPSMLLSSGFFRAHEAALLLPGQHFGLVRLTHGERDVASFRRDVADAMGRDIGFQFSGGEEATVIDRTLRVQTVGLGLLAAVAALVTLAAVGQALSRQLARLLADLPTLVAIGILPRSRRAISALVALPTVLAGAAVAATVAYAASPRVPTGFARTVDPVRGYHLDVLVTTVGVIVWLAVIGSSAVVLGGRSRVPRPPRVGQSARRLLARLPLAARLGSEAALVPLRSASGPAARAALSAAALSLAGVMTIVTFGASLHHLLTTPALQGWSFDAAISAGEETSIDALRSSLSGIADDPAVEQVGWVALVNLTIEGGSFEAYAFDPDASGVHPTMRSGRAPLADDEIALGADLVRARPGHPIGDTVTVAGADGSRRLRVVGSATYPEVANNADLGSTASLTLPAARAIGAQEVGAVALVRLAPGATTAALDRYRSSGEVVTPFEAPRVRNLRQIGVLPWLLAGFVALVGALAIAHGLWVSVRTRRRELSVLRSIGFRPRDVRAMHLAQAACVAAIGIGVGLLASAVVARRAWSIVAAGTAVVDRLVVPAGLLALTALAALVVAGVVGLAAARWSGRTPPAAGLRGE